MSLMLANQYFMGRNFLEAEKLYEKVIKINTADSNSKKKLIICYTETGKVSEAHKLFNNLISADISVVTTTDVLKDDCPCPELIERIQSLASNSENSFQLHVKLGILWLYCNPEKSLEEFQAALNLDPQNSMCGFSILIIRQYLADN